MDIVNTIRNFLDIPYISADGWEYKIIHDEIHLVRFHVPRFGKQRLFAEKLPEYIDGMPVVHIESVYGSCLKGDITIPETVRSIGFSAFCADNDIISITVRSNVQSMDEHALFVCEKLQEAYFEDGVDLSSCDCLLGSCPVLRKVRLPDDMTTLPKCSFGDCEQLEEIKLPDGITVIEECCFVDCYELRSVRWPKKLKRIGDLSFWECDKLESLELPEGVEEIGKDAFSDCCGLKEVIFPSSLKCIEKGAFKGCKTLQKVVFPPTMEYIGKDAFSSCPNLKMPEIPQGCEVDKKAFRGIAQHN